MSISRSATRISLRELEGTPTDLTAEEQATIEALKAEYAKLEAEYENADELPDDVDARLGEIETALAGLRGSAGQLRSRRDRSRRRLRQHRLGGPPLGRSRLRPAGGRGARQHEYGRRSRHRRQTAGEAASLPAPTIQRAVITIGGQPEAEEDEEDIVKPLPDRLVSELTAYRTLALRDAVANNPHVAMTALLHKLCLDTFQHAAAGSLSRSISAARVSSRSSRRT